MPRFRQEHDQGDGWSGYIYPVPDGYRMACCDCGLCHTMEFRVVRVTERFPDGTFETEELDPEMYRVQMRARRNNRSTAQIRRHMKREP